MAKPKFVKNPHVLMNEVPTVIGMMSAVIEGGGSLDTAARDVAESGPKCSSGIFRRIAADADTRASPDIKSGISSMLSSLPNNLTPFRRSLYMVIAASEAADPSERKRMLKDASEISLNGLRETGETYSSSLNGPCMMIFGLGIMVPMLLMSILPMLNIGGMFGTASIGMEPVIFLTLIVIPCIIMVLTISVKEKNPFLPHNKTKVDLVTVAPLLSIIPLCFVFVTITGDAEISIILSAAISGALTFVSLLPGVNREKAREKQEQLLKDSVFETGNRLISGENFETAIVRSIGMREECRGLADAVGRELDICRGDVCSAIQAALAGVSSEVADIYCDIYRCSLKNVRDAGRLAISVGRQLQDQDIVRKGIQNKLKNMTDMMTGTAAVFAPLVLGLSITMLVPISKVMPDMDFGGTSVILSVYLIELCMLMSILTAYLSGRTEVKNIVFRAGAMLPVSMVVFWLCSNIGL